MEMSKSSWGQLLLYLRGLFMISVLTVGGGRLGGGLDTGGGWFLWLVDVTDDGLDNDDDDDEGCDLDDGIWGEAGRFMFPLPGPRPV